MSSCLSEYRISPYELQYLRQVRHFLKCRGWSSLVSLRKFLKREEGEAVGDEMACKQVAEMPI